VFTYLLLRYASGVPPLEKSAEKKWGQDEDWAKYRDDVGVLIPGIGKGKA
jgi:steroid 5-alpha reductase family enzyme